MEMDRKPKEPVVARSHMANCSSVTGMNFFSYKTAHTLTDVLRPGYFSLMAGGLEKFDRIEVTTSAEGEPEHATLIVSAVDPVTDRPTVEVLRRVIEGKQC